MLTPRRPWTKIRFWVGLGILLAASLSPLIALAA